MRHGVRDAPRVRRRDEDGGGSGKKKVRMSSPERWEIKQLIAANVIDKSELPEFDEETGLLPKVDSDEEDVSKNGEYIELFS